jgi:hypothetical protein
MGLSIRAYAAHRGVSHTSVRMAIASGRLTLEPDGSIDPAKADRAGVRNADPSKARGTQALKPVPEAVVGAVKDTLSEAGAPVMFCTHRVLNRSTETPSPVTKGRMSFTKASERPCAWACR